MFTVGNISIKGADLGSFQSPSPNRRTPTPSLSERRCSAVIRLITLIRRFTVTPLAYVSEGIDRRSVSGW
ncbi:hypothetical protein EYF80_050724 [Liparis tanakae]|uniref:Uncharacterized protein n=1 Tax=Liparis tanakae TaxID=230148 RepID=A0A4Z2FEA5_9TELE|nr:hypothetical protein EYF80_050724 [Liparis tanakae]